jgi:hypothetical protein
MHNLKNYANLSESAKKAQAIEDIIEHLGIHRFTEIHEIILRDRNNLRQMELALSFAGIEGYPVKAWYAHIFGDAALVAEFEAEQARVAQQHDPKNND